MADEDSPVKYPEGVLPIGFKKKKARGMTFSISAHNFMQTSQSRNRVELVPMTLWSRFFRSFESRGPCISQKIVKRWSKLSFGLREPKKNKKKKETQNYAKCFQRHFLFSLLTSYRLVQVSASNSQDLRDMSIAIFFSCKDEDSPFQRAPECIGGGPRGSKIGGNGA